MTKVIVLLDKLSRPFVHRSKNVLVCSGICGNLPGRSARDPDAVHRFFCFTALEYIADTFSAGAGRIDRSLAPSCSNASRNIIIMICNLALAFSSGGAKPDLGPGTTY